MTDDTTTHEIQGVANDTFEIQGVANDTFEIQGVGRCFSRGIPTGECYRTGCIIHLAAHIRTVHETLRRNLLHDAASQSECTVRLMVQGTRYWYRTDAAEAVFEDTVETRITPTQKVFVRVNSQCGPDDPQLVIDHVGCFGESVLTGRRRPATHVAHSIVEALVVSFADLASVFQQNPRSARRVFSTVMRESVRKERCVHTILYRRSCRCHYQRHPSPVALVMALEAPSLPGAQRPLLAAES